MMEVWVGKENIKVYFSGILSNSPASNTSTITSLHKDEIFNKCYKINDIYLRNVNPTKHGEGTRSPGTKGLS